MTKDELIKKIETEVKKREKSDIETEIDNKRRKVPGLWNLINKELKEITVTFEILSIRNGKMRCAIIVDFGKGFDSYGSFTIDFNSLSVAELREFLSLIKTVKSSSETEEEWEGEEEEDE